MTNRFEQKSALESDQDFSLTIVRAAGSIALGRKTRGFGTGKLVLPGGSEYLHLNRVQNAFREVTEELGIVLVAHQTVYAGTIHIMDVHEMEDISLHVSMIQLADTVAMPGSQELLAPAWYREDDLPYDEMPADYSIWLPAVLAGYMVLGSLETTYDERTQSSQVVGGCLSKQRLQPLERAEQITIPLS